MDTLPPEIVHEILHYVPKSSLPECRLVCRSFSNLAFPILFSFIHNWLDFEKSHRAVLALAHDIFNRPAVMWSPWASEPDDPVDEQWMKLVWKITRNSDPPGFYATDVDASDDDAQPRQNKEDMFQLTPYNFAQLSGMENMTENRLRTSQNRYLLHQKYASKAVDTTGTELDICNSDELII